MITSTALHLATGNDDSAPAPVLASRPGSPILHVFVTPLTRSGRFTPEAAAPVCRRTAPRRLHTVVPDQPHPRLVGHHQNRQRLCARCRAHLARASHSRARWAATLVAKAKVEPIEDVTATTAGGLPHVVRVDGKDVGIVVRGNNDQWHCHSAGDGVPVNRSIRGPRKADAVAVLAIARELAALPGGVLHEDGGLTLLQRRILDFAARTYIHRGRMENDLRSELGMTATRYFQLLNALVDLHAAEAYAPQVVHRMRRRRIESRHRRHHPLAG